MNPQTRTLLVGFGLAMICAGIVASAAADEAWPPKPTARYSSLEAARDSIGAMVDRCVAGADTAVHVTREPVTFEYLYARGTAKGWAFHITVTDTSECPNDLVENALTDAGWVETFGYSSDGTDGSNMGYVSQNFFCLVEGQWDGGDDTDETYEPEPGCQVTVTCVPRRLDDAPRQ